MGKKKVIEKTGDQTKPLDKAPVSAAKKKSAKTVEQGRIYVKASYNNTSITVTDEKGNVITWASAGGTGFSGPKKATPFAASKVGDVIGSKVAVLGVKDVDVIVLGVGSGREPAIRAFMAHGIEVSSILDATPVPHNGPKAKKPRRV